MLNNKCKQLARHAKNDHFENKCKIVHLFIYLASKQATEQAKMSIFYCLLDSQTNNITRNSVLAKDANAQYFIEFKKLKN